MSWGLRMPEIQSQAFQSHDSIFDGNPVDAIVGREPGWIIKSGISLVFIVVLVLLSITWFIKYPDTLIARITLTSQEPPTNLVAKVSGRIQELYVKDSDDVIKEQLIMRIESNVNYSNLIVLENQLAPFQDYQNLELSLSKISPKLISIDQLGELQIPYNRWLNSVNSFLLFSQVDEHNIVTLNSKLLLQQYHELDKSFLNKKNTWDKKLKLKEKELKNNQQLRQNKLVTSTKISQLESEYLDLKSTLEDLAIELRLNQLKKTEIKNQLNEFSIKHEKDKFQQLVEIDNSLSALSSYITQWKNKYIIRAPFSGKISMSEYWSINQNVSINDNVMKIAKHSDFMIGKLKINHLGAGKITANQQVEIELDSFPAVEFGKLSGKVFGISSVANHDGYLVTVSLPDKLKTSYQIPIQNTSKLVGTAKIITKDRRLIERFFDRLLYFVS